MRSSSKAAPVLRPFRLQAERIPLLGKAQHAGPTKPQIALAFVGRTERPIEIPRPLVHCRRHMIASLTIAVALTLPPSGSHAQFSVPQVVDTITIGETDERNPSMQHNSFFGPSSEWVVYEREEGGMASIWGMRMDMGHKHWNTEVTRLSDYFPTGMVRSPDVAGSAYTPVTLRIVAWEQQLGGRWSIWYSVRSDTDEAWSPPSLLAGDSVDNVDVQLRPISGYVLATWRRGRDLLACRIGAGGRIDTLIVGSSSAESFEFDVNPLYMDETGFIWTSRDSSSHDILSYRYLSFSYFGEPVWTATGGLPLPFPIRKPWLIWTEAWSAQNPPLVDCEADTEGRSHVYFLYPYPGYPPIDLAEDSSADYGNPRGIFNPILTNRSQVSPAKLSFVLSDVAVIERRGRFDSSFVFWPGHDTLYSDTLKGPGQNRNVVVGSPGYWGNPFGWYPVVWESNRSGRWHLYGIYLPFITVDVEPVAGLPAGFRLEQNFPNPFNPSTTIRYGLPSRTHVTLTIFNTLGQQVATLVEGEEEAGYHEAVFDGSGLASGVYLYRLQAGDFLQTRKLILLR
jgi:hypothetical protein